MRIARQKTACRGWNDMYENKYINRLNAATKAWCNMRRKQCGMKEMSLDELKNDSKWNDYKECVEAALAAYALPNVQETK